MTDTSLVEALEKVAERVWPFAERYLGRDNRTKVYHACAAAYHIATTAIAASKRDRDQSIVELENEALVADNATLRARVAELEAGLKWIADTPLQWTKSQNDIYWANVATAMAQSALDTLSKEP